MVLLAGCLLQQPGRTTWDTKLDLTTDPGGFLSRSLHLWNPDLSFGELQNQAYGYLFPQGPFFLLGDLAGVPDWIVQRLWSALLLIVAYEGVRYVARALGLSAGSGVVAGLAYALSPRLLGAAGVLTGEVLPASALPWSLLPLVLFARGRLGARQAGLWSGVGVLGMSGVNAGGLVAVMPLLILVVLAQLRRPQGLRLAAWWGLGVAAACVWWVVPLLLLGRYSPPFLDFIETSAVTTAPTGWSTSVRGSEHWLAYFAIGDQAWWPAAHLVATTPALVVTTGLVAALGVVGLGLPTMPMRGPLLASTAVGLLCLTAANPALLGSLVDGPVRDLLDGVLAPLRNVHKVDLLIRLPLALGAGHAAAVLVSLSRTRTTTRLGAAAVAAVVLAGGLPLAIGQMRMPGYERIPDAWEEAAEFLADQPGSRALVLPGSGFGQQTWGWTIDEPMQGVADTAWATRSQVPLVPGPTARYLDTIERRTSSGEGGLGLAALLARGGITHVVLRRDINPFVAETAPPERVEAALLASPGIRRVAAYGRTGFGEQALIDVYAVSGASSAVSLLDAGEFRRIAGAPDDLLTALDTGALGPGTPVAMGSRQPDTPLVVGDAYRRVERQFGRIHDSVSAVQARGDPDVADRPVSDYPGPDGISPVTSEVLDDALEGVRVTASSSQGYPTELGPLRPEYGPQSAVDGNGETAWRTGSFSEPEGQWLDLVLDRPVRGGLLSVQFERGLGVRVVRARVSAWTSSGETAAVYGVARRGLLIVPLPDQDVHHVRLQVVEALGEQRDFGQVGITEVMFPDRATAKTLVVPEPVSPGDTLLMRQTPPRRACLDIGLGPVCREGQVRPAEDAGRLERVLDVTGSGSWELTGHVVAAPGPSAGALIAAQDTSLRVRANAMLGGDPAVAGVFALDGDPATAWLTGANTRRAKLRLDFTGGVLVRGVSIVRAGGNAVAPETVMLRSGPISRRVNLDLPQQMTPFIAQGRLTVVVTRPDGLGARGRPMGVAEVEVEGLGSRVQPVDLAVRTGAACGLGPEVRVNGAVHATEVTGSLDDVRLGRPLGWRVCDGPVTLGPGRHYVDVLPTAQFNAVDLAWQPVGSSSTPPVDGASERSLQVRAWGATERRVDVGPGEQAVLRVPENTNPGWRATLGGSRLAEVAVDGWQQGYVVPAGEGGSVELVFVPDRLYRTSLFVGLGVAVLLVLATCLGQLHDRRRWRPSEPVVGSRPRRHRRLRGAAWLATAGCFLVLGGPVAAAGVAAAIVRSARRWAPVLAAAGVALSAVAAAMATGTRSGQPGLLADGLAAAGIGLLLGAAVLGSEPLPAMTSLSVMWRSLARHLAAERVVLAGVALVAAQSVVRGVVAAGSYYWQDDYLHLDLSRTLGLTWDYLVRDYSGHVEAGQYAIIWAVGRVAEESFVTAAAVLVALQAIASLLLLVLLRLLFGRSPWLLVPFAAYLFTPIALATATWFAAGLQAYPLQIATLTSLIGLVRWQATRRPGWWLVSVLGHALGLLFWEKAVLVLPTLLAVEILVLSTGMPLRARWHRLRRGWALWLPHGVLLAGYLVAYLTVTSSEDLGAPLQRGLLPTLQDVFLATLLPGIFGGPWHTDGAANTVYADSSPGLQAVFVALFVAVVAASVWRSGHGAWAGWTLVVGYLALDVVLLVLGRGSYLLLVSRDPRYITDALPVIVIGVCAAFSARSRAAVARTDVLPAPPTGHRLARAHGVRSALVAAAMVLGVSASGLVTTAKLAPVVQHERAEEYVATLMGDLDRTPGVAVLTSPVPADVSVSVSLPSLLRAVDHEQVLDRPGRRPRLVSDTGDLVPARLTEPDLTETGPLPDCGWSVTPQPRSVTLLPEPGPFSVLLRVGYLSGTRGVLHVVVGEKEQAARYHPGLGELYFVVSGAGPLRAWVEGADRGLCVTDVQRGVPAPVSE